MEIVMLNEPEGIAQCMCRAMFDAGISEEDLKKILQSAAAEFAVRWGPNVQFRVDKIW